MLLYIGISIKENSGGWSTCKISRQGESLASSFSVAKNDQMSRYSKIYSFSIFATWGRFNQDEESDIFRNSIFCELISFGFTISHISYEGLNLKP